VSKLVLDRLVQRFGPEVLETRSDKGDDTAVVDKGIVVDVVRFLREDPELQFNMLIDLFGMDYREMKREPRFEVVYHFYSCAKKRHRVRLRVPVEEDDAVVPSITSVFPGANWYERECWDMFGIRFSGHPSLRRILLYEEFQGHPLRKDYPFDKRQPRIGTPH
jgi:NADH-quinone oxidoreductase subunit C